MVTSKNGKLLKIQIYKKNAKSAGTKYDTVWLTRDFQAGKFPAMQFYIGGTWLDYFVD